MGTPGIEIQQDNRRDYFGRYPDKVNIELSSIKSNKGEDCWVVRAEWPNGIDFRSSFLTKDEADRMYDELKGRESNDQSALKPAKKKIKKLSRRLEDLQIRGLGARNKIHQLYLNQELDSSMKQAYRICEEIVLECEL